jgi:sulfate transport system permease protein
MTAHSTTTQTGKAAADRRSRKKTGNILPGFGLSLGITLFYLGLIVLVPLSTLAMKTSTLGWKAFWTTVTNEEVVAAYKLSFGASALAALVNTVFGVLVAWVLVRYRFPGRRLIDGLVDLPFALPTAVAGISLTSIYAPDGWIGRYLEPHGITVAYTRLGILVALVFVGLPFVVRTVQPVLSNLDLEVEEAAGSLGASRWQVLCHILLPTLYPAIITGYALCFARALGEYGSVVFISGNLPMQTEIAPLKIMSKLEQFNYPGATAIAVVMLLASFLLLLLLNLLQWWFGKRYRVGG